MAVAFACGAVLTIAAMGIASVENFLRIIGVLGGHRWFSLDPRWEVAAANVSLDAFVARLSPAHRGIVFPAKLVILALTFRATIAPGDDRDGRGLSLWVATMLLLTPVVWLHYMTLLIVPFGLIAVAVAQREVSAPVCRFALLSYCIIVMATPLMSTLTFRKDIFDWRTGMVAEVGFIALMTAWIAAWRFATEPSSESSGRADPSEALPGSLPSIASAAAARTGAVRENCARDLPHQAQTPRFDAAGSSPAALDR